MGWNRAYRVLIVTVVGLMLVGVAVAAQGLRLTQCTVDNQTVLVQVTNSDPSPRSGLVTVRAYVAGAIVMSGMPVTLLPGQSALLKFQFAGPVQAVGSVGLGELSATTETPDPF